MEDIFGKDNQEFIEILKERIRLLENDNSRMKIELSL